MTATPDAPDGALVEAEGDTFDAVVVGAGFSGLYMLHRLRQLGFSAVVLEAGPDLGGTWYWNRYPGARCDVESITYSYSFDPELDQEWEWTERYATQPEILRYANHVADRYQLRDGIRFSTRVTTARYDDGASRWSVATDQGGELDSQFLIMGVGCLSTSKTPEIPGLETFRGPWYHTGHWPHEGVDFTGQRVGVIGTGSSGIQSIPIIAAQAAHTTVFQRTPNYTVPAKNAPLDPAFVRDLKARYPEHRREARQTGVGIPTELPEKAALEVDAAERTERYRQRFESGSLIGLSLSYTDLLIDERANETAAEYVRERIREIVEDPEVAELLAPRDYPFGTKRICLDTGYYATFNRPDVDLVDIRKTPLIEITAHGLRTSAEEYQLDALVFATGFDAMTGSILAIDILGRDGQSLREKWAAGPRTYLGLASAGFPNLFTITGPGSPSVLTNMMVSIEQHVEWIADCLEHLRRDGVATIEADLVAEDGWVDHVNEVANMSLFPRADSWYMGANVPGKPRVFMPYLGGADVYRMICDNVAAKDYEGFTLTA